MIEEREPLRNKEQTAARIKDLVKEYHNDLLSVRLIRNGREIPICNLALRDFFNYVKNIPYRKDKHPLEIISRPYYIMKHAGLGMDCKKKSILCGAYCEHNRIPYRFIGSSRRLDKKVHHIFPQIYYQGSWKNYDATYPYYKPFQDKMLTYAEVL
jgi:hypothetical protein